jgi:hypothetical protein
VVASALLTDLLSQEKGERPVQAFSCDGCGERFLNWEMVEVQEEQLQAGQVGGYLVAAMPMMPPAEALAATLSASGNLVMAPRRCGGRQKPASTTEVLEGVKLLLKEGSAFIYIASGFVRAVR